MKPEITNQPIIDQPPSWSAEQAVELSLIVPLFNEGMTIETLVKTIEKFLCSAPFSSEVLLIDDGSSDESKTELTRCTKDQPRFRVYHFRKNLGKSAAYALGFQKSKGRLIATMDGDLQDDPNDLLSLWDKIQNGADFVSGWKQSGKSVLHKTLLSKTFNALVRILTGLHLHDINCPLRVFKRTCVSQIALQGNTFRYLPILVHWRGYLVEEHPVKNLERVHGKSKFGLSRYFQTFFDLFTVLFLHAYREKPMQFFGLIGLAVALMGFSIDSILVIHGLFFSGRIGHFALLLCGVFLMLSGLQIILFGFLGSLLVDRRTISYHHFLTEESQ